MWMIPDWLFDADWYESRYAAVIPAEMAGREHYDRFGSDQNLSPHPLFDTDWYFSCNPTAVFAGISAPEHYLKTGSDLGYSPHPLFENRSYRDAYRDKIAAAVTPLEHYITVGEALDFRPSPLFDTGYYRLRHGNDTNASALLKHYLAHGHLPGHDPNEFFDTAWYIDRNDIGARSALEHYVLIGEQIGLLPHPLWDEELYLSKNAKLRKLVACGVLLSGYRHFVAEGSLQADKGQCQFFFNFEGQYYFYNSTAYLQDNPAAEAALASGRISCGLAYLFSEGLAAFKGGQQPFYSSDRDVRLIDNIEGSAAIDGRYLCLFAHFDRHDLVDPYVITYLKALRSAGADIVFITPTGNAAELEKVLPYVSRVLVKVNHGHDFGSWWLALSELGLDITEGYQRVIFANDSIYFPVRPAEPLFEAVSRQTANVFALSDSYEVSHHLQSYFLSFDETAQRVLLPIFMESFACAHLLPKSEIIQRYEIGLTRMAREQGLTCSSFYSARKGFQQILENPKFDRWKKFMSERLGVCNPSIVLWDMLIEHFDWPALKVAFLISSFPFSRERASELPRLVADGAQNIQDVINHQRRIAS